MLYPLTFQPAFKERIWGGRKLSELYAKDLPPGVPIGESWEIYDRPDQAAIISSGPLHGRSLRWLMQNHRKDLLGKMEPHSLFPYLVKILSAREKLSLQVHPRPDEASQFGVEPKSEFWFITDASPGAEIYLGLNPGVTRSSFEECLLQGLVENCFQRVPVQPGDAVYLPSGTVHGIGAGIVLFEVQQNSDTTYRIYDWNRLGPDGQPRSLHIPESLAAIDFAAETLPIVHASSGDARPMRSRALTANPLFQINLISLSAGDHYRLEPGTLKIYGVWTGGIVVEHQFGALLAPGSFCLIPASCACELGAPNDSTFLEITPPAG